MPFIVSINRAGESGYGVSILLGFECIVPDSSSTQLFRKSPPQSTERVKRSSFATSKFSHNRCYNRNFYLATLISRVGRRYFDSGHTTYQRSLDRLSAGRPWSLRSKSSSQHLHTSLQISPRRLHLYQLKILHDFA